MLDIGVWNGHGYFPSFCLRILIKINLHLSHAIIYLYDYHEFIHYTQRRHHTKLNLFQGQWSNLFQGQWSMLGPLNFTSLDLKKNCSLASILTCLKYASKLTTPCSTALSNAYIESSMALSAAKNSINNFESSSPASNASSSSISPSNFVTSDFASLTRNQFTRTSAWFIKFMTLCFKFILSCSSPIIILVMISSLFTISDCKLDKSSISSSVWASKTILS